MRGRVIELLRDEDMHATGMKKALKLSSRDYSAFDACMESLIIDDVVVSYTQGKGTFYTLREANSEEAVEL